MTEFIKKKKKTYVYINICNT